MAETYRGGDARDHLAKLEALRSSLLSGRSSFDAHWKELGDWMLPRRTRFWSSDRNKGDRRNQNIIDSTARFAARTLQSGLHAGLTSPARPWFKLDVHDPSLRKHQAVKQWLADSTQRMLDFFLSSNLYNVLPILYGDMGVFGTAAMSVVDDTKDLFRCYPYPIGSYALGLNRRGVVSTFVREYELSCRQVIEEFALKPDGTTIDWTKITTQTKALWDHGDYESPVTIVWIVLPNVEADKNRLQAKYLPFASCHYELGCSDRYLRESGFKTFPILAPRWDLTGEDTYGTDSPGMTTLGDVKQLQIMQRRKGQAISKMIDPPLQAPTALRSQKTSLLPGDITYVDTREGMHGLRSIHEVTLNIQHLREDIQETQYRIQRGFYEDLFLMLAQSDQDRGSQPITAREVVERHEEKLLALGPVLERTNDELLDPLVDRVWAMMVAANLITPPPPQLEEVELKVEYTSIMAQAMKMVGVGALERFVVTIGTIADVMTRAQTVPEIRHKINTYALIDHLAETLGIDPGLVRPTEEAEQLQQQEAAAAKAQQDAEQAVQMSQAAKNAAGASMDGDTVLSRVMGGAAGSETVQ